MSLLFVQPIWPAAQGEKLLLAAVIRRAAYDVALYKGAKKLVQRRMWEGAFNWLMSDREDYFTSFVSICNLLDQDPKELRRKALKLTRKDVKKYDLVDAYGRF
jgi:hypothetical protein